MPIDNFPLVDTTDLDMLASGYGSFQNYLNPVSLLSTMSNGHTVEDEMLGMIRSQAFKELSGLAIIASAQFAIGLDEIDQLEPSIVGNHGECTFAGRIADIAIYDFTLAASSAGMILDDGEKLVAPGLVFSTDSTLEDFMDNTGILSLAPFCAIMPGSLYELREIPHPWLR